MPFAKGNKINAGVSRPQSGRKPDQWKKIHDRALTAAVSEEALKAIYVAMVDAAKAGNTKAAGLVIERVAGKLEQPIAVSGDADKPLIVKHEYDAYRKMDPDTLIRIHTEKIGGH